MAWYQVKGKDTDVVVSTRVRLARNLRGFGFGKKLSNEDAKKVIDRIENALEGKDYIKTEMEELSEVQALALVEQHLISREFAAKKSPHALFRNDNKSLSLMACEEDHIRLQCILPGFAPEDAYRFAAECDEQLDGALDIAFDERLGYLTHCPTNLGTGMRASVMLFLPALTKAGQISHLSRQLARIGLTMRGLYGEGSESRGYLYQVSNQVTLGVSEQEILNRLTRAVESIAESERRLRTEVTGDAAERRADRIHRAEGVLRHARLISSDEFFNLFADLKLGIALGEITSISDEVLHTLLINALPATLTEQAAEPIQTATDRDKARAAFIKQALEVTGK